MRTADTIAQQAESRPVTSKASKNELRERRMTKIRPYQWQPGQSGNPNGARKSDVARRIAKRIFENNEEEAYTALAKALLKGNAYVFKELADRAYGKLKDKDEGNALSTIAAFLNEGRKRVAARRQPSER